MFFENQANDIHIANYAQISSFPLVLVCSVLITYIIKDFKQQSAIVLGAFHLEETSLQQNFKCLTNSNGVWLTVCFYHVMYAFQSEFTL